MDKLSSYRRFAFYILVGTLLSKVSGFFREIVIGLRFGTNYEMDAYLVAMTMPTLLVSVLTAAVSTTFIPTYTRINTNDGYENANLFTNRVLTLMGVVTILISLGTFMFAKCIIPVIAPGFSGEVLALSIRITRIISVFPFLLGLSSVMVAYLQSNNEFFLPAIAGLFENGIIILSLLITKTNTIFVLAIASIAGLLARIVPLMFSIKKKGMRYRIKLQLNDQYVRHMLVLIIPVIIGISIQQINVLVDRILASGLQEGSISALNYANRLNLFVYGVFSMSIASAIYPSLSKLYEIKDKKAFKATIETSVNTVLLVIVPISVGTIVLSKPIVDLVFQRGAFDSGASSMTSVALLYYSIGIVGFALRDIFSRIFYSIHDTKTPMYNGIYAIIINIVLNIILVRCMYHGGLALATSISGIVTSIMLFVSLYKKLEGLEVKHMLTESAKIMISALIMGIAVFCIDRYLIQLIPKMEKLQQLIRFVIAVAFGVVTYSACVLAFKVKEAYELINTIKNRKIKLL